MKFSCSRCGQRYASIDEPEPGRDYRIPCVACGGVLLLGGAAFPALPTSNAEPAGHKAPGQPLDAAREVPLSLALAPVAVGQPSPPRPSPAASQPPAAPALRWLRLAAAAALALATAGAGALLLLGGPTSDALSAEGPSVESRPATLPGAAEPVPSDSVQPLLPSGTVPSSSPPPAAPPRTRAAPQAGRPSARGAGRPAHAAGDGAGSEEAPASLRSRAEQVIANAIAARRAAFETCVRQWLESKPRPGATGRRLDLSLVVNPTGTVTSPKIDDPALEASPLGGCLRNAASKPFPAFEGEPIQLRIPLRLAK